MMYTMRVRTRHLTAGIVIAVIIASLGIGTWNASRPVPAIAAALGTLPASTPSLELAWPTQGVAAVGAVDFGVLATSGEQTPRPIASIAKAITALAVLERAPLQLGEQGAVYTITDADVARFHAYVAKDGSVTPVAAGTQLNQYQALQTLLLPSSNNMADSLATWVFGSLEAYFGHANEMVKRLGMTHTTVGGDASGFSPATVSTPQDLIRLGESVLKHPVLAQIVGQTAADLPMAGSVRNTNALLGIDGVIGIKTGTSDEAGGCLLSAATYELEGGKTITVIAAILGSPDRSAVLASTPPLLVSTHNHFSYETLLRKGAIIGTYALPWGATVTAVADKSLSLIRWEGDRLTTKATLNRVDRELPQGAKLGTLKLASGKAARTSDVVAKTAVPGPSLWWRATRH